MKIRKGFVSNSSSCSFVIHKSYFKNDEDVKYLEGLYNELKLTDEIYDDEGLYFLNETNYVSFKAYGGDGYNKLKDALAKFDITDKKIVRLD